MRLTNQVVLAAEGISARKGRTFLLALGVSVGTAALIFLMSLILGAKEIITTQLGEVRKNLLVVKSDPERPYIVLDDSAYTAMCKQASETPGIEMIYRVLPVYPRHNMQVAIAENLRIPAPPIQGMDENLFKNNNKHNVMGFQYTSVPPVSEEELIFENSDLAFSDDEPYIPVILPRMTVSLFDIFGSQDPGIEKFRKFVDVPGNGEPGTPFYVLLSRKNPADGSYETRAYRCRVVGYENIVPAPITIAIPYRYAREWNEFLDSAPHFDSLILEVAGTPYLEKGKNIANDAGFLTEANEGLKILMLVSRSTRYLLVIAVIFCLIIAVVAAIGIFNGLSISVMEQARRIGILRSVGASRRDIVSIYILEAAFIGLLGCIIGLIVSHLIMWGCNIGVKEYMENLTVMKIQTMFTNNFLSELYIALGAFGMGLTSSLLAGAAPAYRASRLDPAVVLREG